MSEKSLMMTKIPDALLGAKAALDAAIAAERALARSATRASGEAAQAAVRLPGLDREIERLDGLVAADDALAGIASAGEARMGAEERLAAEGDLGALRGERDELARKSRAGEAAARALRVPIAEKAAAIMSARRDLARELRHFLAALEQEFARDTGKLTLPQLFMKWSAIGGGLRYSPLPAWLDGILIPSSTPGVPTLARGLYCGGDGKTVEWRTAWRDDQPLRALHQQLAEIAAACAATPTSWRPRSDSRSTNGSWRSTRPQTPGDARNISAPRSVGAAQTRRQIRPPQAASRPVAVGPAGQSRRLGSAARRRPRGHRSFAAGSDAARRRPRPPAPNGRRAGGETS